ncbi:DUF4377 domain-containing protein [Aquimarina litoralis]|uniref:DUF4377 domain-containing protein n=1 Tax=Aquimarina litoralis TaxID=584605 RepID=UPI001C55D534|nr:DUF4377 domain-containing protein [Aquimarina litoralis]MBW1295560.1 DUF4377 domain-containing protein [Aquimarina litoralis]
MKRAPLILILLLLIISCNDDDDVIEITSIRVNHYLDTGFITFFGNLGVINTIQEGNQIGQEEFLNSYSEIQGFEYELGFIHDLLVKKIQISDPPQDGSSIKLELLEVLSKQAAPLDTEFKIQLTLNTNEDTFLNWVIVDQENNFSLINSSISIECGSLCLELLTRINNQEQITGVFTHGENNTYILQNILDE